MTKSAKDIIGLHALPRPQPAHLVRRIQLPQFKTNPGLTPEQLTPGGFFPGELLQTYALPSYAFANGAGMKIAIVGYSDSTDADNQGLWCGYVLVPGCGMNVVTLAPYPTVNHFEATGSIPPHKDDNSLEATLDAQMVGGTAPGAIILTHFNMTDANALPDYIDTLRHRYSLVKVSEALFLRPSKNTFRPEKRKPKPFRLPK